MTALPDPTGSLSHEVAVEPAVVSNDGSGATNRLLQAGRRWLRRGGVSTLVFALPMIIIFGVFSWSPIVQSVIMSFQKTNLVSAPRFVGWDNFNWVLTDPNLPIALRNTGYFALLALIFGYPVPLIGAILMSEVRRAKGLYSALAYLPVVVPPVVAVLLWKFFYSGAASGVFNQLLAPLGLGPFPWIQSQASAMPSLVLESTWANAGSTCIIYLAALIGVPAELYDAAEVDGAGIWRKLWHVTLPQLRGVLFITFILQIIGTAQVFLEPYLFTGGGPARSTLTILLMIYNYAFGASVGANYGAATALSIMLAIVLAIFSLIYFKATQAWSTT